MIWCAAIGSRARSTDFSLLNSTLAAVCAADQASDCPGPVLRRPGPHAPPAGRPRRPSSCLASGGTCGGHKRQGVNRSASQLNPARGWIQGWGIHQVRHVAGSCRESRCPLCACARVSSQMKSAWPQQARWRRQETRLPAFLERCVCAEPSCCGQRTGQLVDAHTAARRASSQPAISVHDQTKWWCGFLTCYLSPSSRCQKSTGMSSAPHLRMLLF